jgi:hypothetical protein
MSANGEPRRHYAGYVSWVIGGGGLVVDVIYDGKRFTRCFIINCEDDNEWSYVEVSHPKHGNIQIWFMNGDIELE